MVGCDGFDFLVEGERPSYGWCARKKRTRCAASLNKQMSQEKSEWMWVTTLPVARASTALVVHLGHARWDIENYGFNELVNGWHADHIYKHDPQAIEAFTLLAFLAYNLFHAFLARNIKRATAPRPDGVLLGSAHRGPNL